MTRLRAERTGKQFVLSVTAVDDTCSEDCDLLKPQLMEGCLAPLPVEKHAMSPHY